MAVEHYRQALEELISRRNDPQWLVARRRAALAAFEDVGFPTRRNEEWKYTNVGALAKLELAMGDCSINSEEVAAVANDAALPEETARVVFVAGAFDAELSDLTRLPKGVRIRRWIDVAAREELIDQAGADPVGARSGFDALRSAFVSDGVVVDFEPETVVKAPIHIVYVGAPANDGSVWTASLENIVRLGGHAEGTIVESFVGVPGATYLTNIATRAALGDDAELRHVRIQDESNAAFHVASDEAVVSRDARYRSFNFSIGGKVARDSLSIRVEGPGAHTDIAALYLPTDGQLIDNHTVIDHRAPNCTADQLYKGVLDGSGHGVFNGKVLVRRAAQQTNANQLNQNLMLSRNARIDTKPQLEIFADDVRCTHGATIGQIEQDELFYMQSRAIPEERARRMIIRGFAGDTLERVHDSGARAQMLRLLDLQLSA